MGFKEVQLSKAETWDFLLMIFISDALPQVQDAIEDADRPH